MSVTLTGFWLGKHEVTQAEWKSVMGTTVEQQEAKTSFSSLPGTGPNHPMYFVSHDEATEFAQKYTQQERAAGRLPAGWEYRLPTEAQWEYGCRAGTKTRFVSGDDEKGLEQYAWFSTTADGATHEVGTKKANAWGLCDMHGNVWEWCRDLYGSKLPGGRDPEDSVQASDRVDRGGSWSLDGFYCRSASRGGGTPESRFDFLGFRLAAVRVSH